MSKPRIPKVLVKLGYCLNIVIAWSDEEHTYSFPEKAKFLLCTNTSGTALFIFQDTKLPSGYRAKLEDLSEKSAKNFQVQRGIKMFEKWSDWEPEKFTHQKVSERKIVRHGNCLSITYRSDKWTGKDTDYIHTFDDPPIVHLNDLEDPSFIQISKGKLKVESRGIVG